MKKKIISLILAFLMLVTTLPVLALAQEEGAASEELEKPDCEFERIDGQDYIKISLPANSVEIKEDPYVMRPMSITDNVPDQGGAGQLINWGAGVLWYDYKNVFPPKDGKYIVELRKLDKGKSVVIGEVEITKAATSLNDMKPEKDTTFQFKTNKNYVKGDENLNLEIRFPVRLRQNILYEVDTQGVSGTFNGGNKYNLVFLKVSRLVSPIYTAEWDTTNGALKPTLKGRLYTSLNEEDRFKIFSDNDCYGSILNEPPVGYIEEKNRKGALIERVAYEANGKLTSDDVRWSKGSNIVMNGEFSSYVVSVNGQPQDRPLNNKKGTIPSYTEMQADFTTGTFKQVKYPTYFYNLVGDNDHMWRFQLKEGLELKFNTGVGSATQGGQTGQEIGNPQTVAYGEKFDSALKGSFSENTLTLPETTNLAAPTLNKNNLKMKFIGWKLVQGLEIPVNPQKVETDGEGKQTLTVVTPDYADKATLETALKAADFKGFTEKNPIFYAIYGQTQGKANVKYVDDKGTELAEDLKIQGQDYKKEKIGELNEAVTANINEAPQFKDYAISKVEIDPANGTYADPATATIKFVYKAKATTDDKSSDQDYIEVTFNANEGHFGTETEKTKNVWVLKDKATFADAKGKVSNPTKDNAFFNEWQTAATGGTKVADDKTLSTADEKFYANYTTKAQGNASIQYLDVKTNQAIEDKYRAEDAAKYPAEKDGNQGKKVTVEEFTKEKAPKFVGYEFARVEISPKDGTYALPATSTVKVYYNKLADVIEDDTPNDNNDKPEGYVTVTFKPGVDGVLNGKKENVVYYVNPKADKTNADITEPTITANTGYKVADPKWNPQFDKVSTTAITADATYTAQYKKIVVPGPDQPKKPDPNNPGGTVTDDDYVKVEFLPGEHGTFEKVGQLEQTTIFWVLKGEKANFNPPTVTEKENYKFTGWDKEVKDSYTANETYTATYKEKVKTTEPSDEDLKYYAEVEFKAGENGNFEQIDVVGQGGQIQKKDQVTKFWVLKNEKVTFNPPQVTANAGYSFTGWKEPVKETYAENTIHTAQYSNSISDKKIEGWTELTFNQGAHGKLANGAKNVKWVDPKVELKLSDIAPGIVADTNYSFNTWTKPGEGANAQAVEVALDSVAKYDKPITFTATYKANVIDDEKDIPGDDKKNFVKVIFDKGDHGKFVDADGKAITTEISTNVRMSTEVDLTEKAPKVMPDSGYGHTGWKTDQGAINLAKVKVDVATTITATYIKGEFDENNINDILVLGPKKAAYAEGDTLDLTGLTILAIDNKGIRKEYTVSQDNKLKAADGKELTGASLSVGATAIDLANLPKLTHKAHNDKPITLTKDNTPRESKVHLTVSMNKTPQPTDLVAANQGENPTKTNIKGKAQKGDTVKIYLPGQKDPIATVKVTNDDGTFETSVSKENKAYDVGTKFNVTATAKEKEESSPQEVKVIKDVNGDWKDDDAADQKTPTPTAKALNVGKEPKVTTITGKAEPNAKVVAKVGNIVVGEATSDAKGDYKIEATKTGKADGEALDKDTEVKVTAQVDKKLVSDPTATVVKIDKDGNGGDDDKEKFDIKKVTKVEIIKNPDKMDYLVNKPEGKANFETKGLVVKFTDDSGKSATYNAEELANMSDVTIKPANNEEIGLTSEGKTNKMDLTVTVTGAEATDKPTAKADRQVIVKLDADGNKIADEDEQTPEPTVTARNIGTDGPDGKKVPATKTTVEIETEKNADVIIEYKDANDKTQKIVAKADDQGKLTKKITPKLKEGTDVKVTVKDGEKKPTDKTVKVFEDLDDNKIPDTQAGQTERPAAIASNKGKTPTFTTIAGKTEPGTVITVTLTDGSTVKVDEFNIDTDGNYTLQATVGEKPLENGAEILVYAKNAPKKISNPQKTTVFNDFNEDGKPDGGKVDLTDVKEIQVIAPKKMSYTQGEKLDGTGLKAVITDNKGGIEIFDYDNAKGEFKDSDGKAVDTITATVNGAAIKDLALTEKDHDGKAIDVKVGTMSGSTNQKLEVKQLQTPTPTIVFAANQNTVGSDGTTPTQTPKDTTTVKFTVVNKPTTVYVKYTDNGVAKEESFEIKANDDTTKTVELGVKLPVGAEVQVLAKDADKSLSKPATANVVRDADNNGTADNKTPLDKAKIDDIKAGADKILVTPPKGATELVISEMNNSGDTPKGSTPIALTKDGSLWKTTDGKPVTVENGKLVIPKGTFKLDEYNVVEVESKGDPDTTTPSKAYKTVGEAADTTAPAKPIVDPPIAGDTDVKVKTPAEQDAKTITVEIKKTGEAPKTIVVTKGDDGKWKTPDGKEVNEENGKLPVSVTPKLDTGDTVTVITKDDSGNPSEANIQTVAERQQLPAPTINPIKTGEKTVAGKAEKAATVDIYKKNAQGGFDLIAKDVGVGPDGSYTFNNPDGFKDNDVIKVVSKKPGMIDNSSTTTVGVDTSGLDEAIQDGKDALDPEKGGKNNGTKADKDLEKAIQEGEDLKNKTKPSPATQGEIDAEKDKIVKAIEEKKNTDKAMDDLKKAQDELDKAIKEAEKERKPKKDIKEAKDTNTKAKDTLDKKDKNSADIEKLIKEVEEQTKQMKKPVVMLYLVRAVAGENIIVFRTNPGKCIVKIIISHDNGEETEITAESTAAGAGSVKLEKALKAGEFIDFEAKDSAGSYLDGYTPASVNN